MASPSTVAPPTLQPAANLQQVNVGYPAPSTSWLPLEVADQQGYFGAQGLKMNFSQATTSTLVAGLLSGDLHFGVDLTGPVQAVVQQQAPLRAVAAVAVKPQHSFLVQSSINAFSDLVGKTVGVNQILDFTHWEVITLLQQNGVDPSQVNFIAIPASPSRVAALQSGQIQGTVLGIPFDLQAKAAGFKELGSLSRDLNIAWVGLACGQNTLSQQQDLIVRTLTATLQGLRFVRQYRDATLAIMQSWLSLDAATSAQAYDECIGTFSTDGTASDEAWTNTLQVAELAGSVPSSVPVSSFVDTAPLQQAQQKAAQAPV